MTRSGIRCRPARFTRAFNSARSPTSPKKNGCQFLTVETEFAVVISLEFADELQALPGIRNVSRKKFQDSNHLGDLRLIDDGHLVVRRFQTFEIDVRLPGQSFAHKAEALVGGRNGQDLSRKEGA